ncbi:MAG: DNA primase, partial [Clostridia bacterium]|nr:DNA primase [Clostridia bacterium]
FKAKGTDEKILLELGLISEKNGKYYDKFRNRVIFPIINTAGEVIAFGGRVMDDSKPKYLNTSDTPAFKKSRNLFALNYAKNYCSEQMILCEGYMDVIALHAAGFQNAVATLGTALTSDQARLMKKYTKTVLISYDSDEAGQRAANKAFQLLGEAGLETRILRMEGAKDPDEYIQKFGKLAFQKVIDSSFTQFDYKFEAILKKHDPQTADGRIKASDEAAEVISRVYSSVERDIYIKKAADKLSISPDSLKRDVENKISRRRKATQKEETQKMIQSVQGYGDRVNPDRIKNLKAAAAEEVILGILLKYPEYSAKIRSGKIDLKSGDFVSDFSRRVFDAVTEAGDDFEPGMLNSFFSEAEMARLVKLQIAREGLSNTDEVFSDSVKTLKEASKKAEMSIEDIIAAKRNKQ